MKVQGTLLNKTIQLLHNNRPLEKVSRETGLSLYWLQKLVRSEIPDPSVNKVQKLYEHLAQQELNLG